MATSRQDLLQSVVQRMMSIMRHVRHPAPPPGALPLSPPQANILFTIAHHKEGMSVKDLAEHTGVTPGAITQFVDGLVEKGLVAREGDTLDRRVVRLKITDLAINKFEKFREEHFASFTTIFESLTTEDIKILLSLLEKIESSQIFKEKTNAEPDKTP
jgi:DNA-binding MarR family transcriptional regulator